MTVATTYAYISRKPSGKVIVEGTRIAVADVAALAEEGLSAAQIQEQYPTLTLAQIHAALAYYYDHKAEIIAESEKAHQLTEELRRRFPGRVG